MEDMKAFMEGVANWRKAKDAAAMWREREANWRKHLFGEAFDAHKTGVQKLVLPDGVVLKGTAQMNVSVDLPMLRTVQMRLSSEHNVAPELVFPIKYNFAAGEYKKLTPVAKKVADLALITKPGTPKLEV